MSNAIALLTARVAALESAKANMMQLAKVTEVHDATNLLNVEVRGVLLTNVPFLTMRAGTNGQTYWLPELNELGMLFSPGGDVGNAVFLPAMFYDGVPAPETDQNIMRRIFTNDADEKWDFNDDEHVLRIGGDADRQTNKNPAKIEDRAHNSKLTLEEGTAKLETSSTAKLEIQSSGNAELAATVMGKLVLSAVAANLVGCNFHPTGLTTLMTAMGPAFFAPAPAPSGAPSPPSGTPTDGDGNVTGSPPQTVNNIAVNAGSSLSFILPTVPCTTPVGPGATVPTAISVTITSGTLNITIPSQSF